MSSLIFHVGEELPPDATSPCCLLKPDNWDDYSYRTSFVLSVFVTRDGEPKVIGGVKVLKSSYPERTDSYEKMRTADFLARGFERLEEDTYCSLGQSSDYYANLFSLSQESGDSGFAQRIALALNDVCVLGTPPTGWVSQNRGYTESLLRLAAAHIARRDGASLMRGETPEQHDLNAIPLAALVSSHFQPRGIELQFDASLSVPGRINVVVGKNGSGKTYFLSQLAEWIGGPQSGGWDKFTPRFSRVVMVSSNTFDRGRKIRVDDAGQSVRYVGPIIANWDDVESVRSTIEQIPDAEWAAKVPSIFPTKLDALRILPIIEGEVIERLVALRANHDWRVLAERLFDDETLGVALFNAPQQALRRMSAGQKALASIYSGVFSHLDKQGLVLLDEPENFLHPSLISKFVRNMNELLRVKKGFAVLATHSPIVVQETPSRFVWVMERTDSGSQFTQPHFETFGESIENIDEYLFETDFRSSHWKHVLRELVLAGLTNAEIGARVGQLELSLAARAYIERERGKRQAEVSDAEP